MKTYAIPAKMGGEVEGAELDRRTGNRTKPQGRHPHNRLTAITLNARKAPGRYADGNGLYLVVDPSGAKRWMWRGVIRGKRCELGLGGLSTVPLADARARATAIRRKARDGEDPRVDRRRAQRGIPTFKAAAIAVHAEHRKGFRNAQHAAWWLASLENDVFPLLGSRPLDTITSADVLKVLTPIWTVKPETARRVKQRIKLIFDWGKASGFCPGDNPTEGLTKVLPKHTDDQQHLAALAYRDVPAFVTALRAIPNMREEVREALEFIILTATRTGEIRLATWDEIDFDAATWTIPAARMKAGKEHRIPLVPRAIAILKAAHARRQDGTAWIFPGVKPGQMLSNMTLLKAARRLTTAPLTTHGFRSSFRDWSAERTNIPRDVCEAALAHTLPDKVEAAYRRTDLFEKRRDLMDRWSQFVTSTPGSVLAIGA